MENINNSINSIGNGIELNEQELEQAAGGKNKPKTVVTTGNVHVRKGPGLDYASMGTLAKGTTVSYLGSTKKDERGVAWYKINFNGNVGWVSSKYSKLA